MLKWMNMGSVSFNAILLLEEFQLELFPGYVSEKDLAIALHANPAVEWYLRHKAPEISTWLDTVLSQEVGKSLSDSDIRQAEKRVLERLEDMIVYVLEPQAYDKTCFMEWNESELMDSTDFSGKTIADIGSGTGRLALAAAKEARIVYAVEPVCTLRRMIKWKASQHGLDNIYVVDGLATDIPFAENFFDIVVSGHVVEGEPEQYAEIERVTKDQGMCILCPGNIDRDDERHLGFVEKGFSWSTIKRPDGRMCRRYWRVIDKAHMISD